MKIINKIKENFWWCLIVSIVVITSLPSLYRIYNIRYLYLSSVVRTQAVAANVALREDLGIGATDLKLKKILASADKTVFYFDYFYHGSGNMWGKGRVIYKLEFIAGNLSSIEEL